MVMVEMAANVTVEGDVDFADVAMRELSLVYYFSADEQLLEGFSSFAISLF